MPFNTHLNQFQYPLLSNKNYLSTNVNISSKNFSIFSSIYKFGQNFSFSGQLKITIWRMNLGQSSGSFDQSGQNHNLGQNRKIKKDKKDRDRHKERDKPTSSIPNESGASSSWESWLNTHTRKLSLSSSNSTADRGQPSLTSKSQRSQKSQESISKLPFDDYQIYPFEPLNSSNKQVLFECPLCHSVLLASHYSVHLERCHRNVISVSPAVPGSVPSGLTVDQLPGNKLSSEVSQSEPRDLSKVKRQLLKTDTHNRSDTSRNNSGASSAQNAGNNSTSHSPLITDKEIKKEAIESTTSATTTNSGTVPSRQNSNQNQTGTLNDLAEDLIKLFIFKIEKVDHVSKSKIFMEPNYTEFIRLLKQENQLKVHWEQFISDCRNDGTLQRLQKKRSISINGSNLPNAQPKTETTDTESKMQIPANQNSINSPLLDPENTMSEPPKLVTQASKILQPSSNTTTAVPIRPSPSDISPSRPFQNKVQNNLKNSRTFTKVCSSRGRGEERGQNQHTSESSQVRSRLSSSVTVSDGSVSNCRCKDKIYDYSSCDDLEEQDGSGSDVSFDEDILVNSELVKFI